MHACVHEAACLPNQERSAQEEDQAVWAQVKRKEEQRLQKERAILSRQSQVLLKLPTKREKAEVRRLASPSSAPSRSTHHEHTARLCADAI